MTLLLPLLAFLFASLLVTAAAMALSPGAAATIERRLGEIRGVPIADELPSYRKKSPTPSRS